MTDHEMYNKIRNILEEMVPSEYRWLFCVDDPEVNDCACCLTSLENRTKYKFECTCVCHDRIKAIAKRLNDVLLADTQEQLTKDR